MKLYTSAFGIRNGRTTEKNVYLTIIMWLFLSSLSTERYVVDTHLNRDEYHIKRRYKKKSGVSGYTISCLSLQHRL